ncbi:unnamed protein product [Brassicogethes aeneus]|uniref:Transposase domain-containing protein n=1 Tax=Brassicogethes aeneus TaxID=1431903 RepID=A0A9P0AQ40_BRAAE|nr:unnamed protein product [Brassicogethes aeneus]
MEPGEYVHIGLSKSLIELLSSVHNVPSELILDISTDGAVADNHSTKSYWPIQIRVINVPNTLPIIIGLYLGKEKPSDSSELFQYVADEFKVIEEKGGINFQNKLISVKFNCFIGDAPARAYVLKHVGHTSYNACSKCKIVGQYRYRRMCFLGVNHCQRTNEEYNARGDKKHHRTGESPLSLLKINPVSNVPFDYMHLVLLGVMKKLFHAWIEGKFSGFQKLTAEQIEELDRRLKSLDEWCPSEFARRPDAVSSFAKYKATQFRHFLLYAGPCVLLNILPDYVYTHFILLHTSIRILATPSPTKAQLIYAKHALNLFVNKAPEIYGKDFMSFNIHGLVHLVDDVKRLGPLDSHSAFCYENKMPEIHKSVRTHYRPLQQFLRRTQEKNMYYKTRNIRSSNSICAYAPHTKGPLPLGYLEECIQYTKITSENFLWSTERKDRNCLLKDNSVCLIENIILVNGIYHLIVRRYNKIEKMYKYNIPSQPCTDFFKCSDLMPELVSVPFYSVLQKCYRMPAVNFGQLIEENIQYIVPLLHEN